MERVTTYNYKNWFEEIKNQVRTAQTKVAIAANKELILFYWDLGQNIAEALKKQQWGNKTLETLSKDLSREFPDIKGFSVTNLRYMKLFYEYFSTQELIHHHAGDELPAEEIKTIQRQFVGKFVAQIPWRHIVEIISKVKALDEVLFYIKKTIENNWSRDVLALQIKSALYHRIGKSVTNFETTLPAPMSDLAKQTLKDPYVFDFLQLAEDFNERDIEKQMLVHIEKFLLELGKGFAFIGRQFHLQVGNRDNYLDLLFYHTKLKCYIVIELKNTAFEPEYAGKLNYYLSAVDSFVKEETDNPTLGILLCRTKDNLEVEFALRDINKPIGVSQFELTNILPENLKSSLPTIDEIEKSFK